MRISIGAFGTVVAVALLAVPSASNAGWSSRMSPESAPVVSTQRILREAPLAENYKFPTKADKVVGMAPYTALATSPYAAPPPPAPLVMTPASPDPVYFGSVARNR